jgi:hypothetical protein
MKLEKLPAYRGWDVDKGKCETKEALSCFGYPPNNQRYKISVEILRNAGTGIRRGS